MAIVNTAKITPFLWFEKDGREAAEYYTSIFPGSRILSDNGMVTNFELSGQRMAILTAGPHLPFNDAISFYVDCRDQEEVDRYWDRFIDDGGTESMCGWLQDRYGVRWQLIPQALIRLTNDPDPARAKRVVGAMLRMKRIVVRDLEQAYKDPS